MNDLKTCFVLLFFTLSVVSISGQTIDIFQNDVRGLQTTFRLNGIVGKSTPTKGLQIMNRTRQAVQVFARPHVEEDALFFIDLQGTTRLEFSLTIAPGQGATLYMFGFLDQGDNLQCEGYVALSISPIQKNGSYGENRTVKMPVALHFQSGRSNNVTAQLPRPGNNPSRSTTRPPAPATTVAPNRPDRYDVITYEGLPMRWDARQLPLKVYSDHGNGGDAAQYASVVRRAVDIWNAVGRESGLKKDFFRIVSSAGQADFRLDWTGTHLLPDAQGTAYPSDGLIGMMPLGRFRSLARAGETLLQEMGHVLGLGHSEIGTDIMYHRARNYCPNLDLLAVSDRDKQMLIWLYNQKKYVAIKD